MSATNISLEQVLLSTFKEMEERFFRERTGKTVHNETRGIFPFNFWRSVEPHLSRSLERQLSIRNIEVTTEELLWAAFDASEKIVERKYFTEPRNEIDTRRVQPPLPNARRWMSYIARIIARDEIKSSPPDPDRKLFQSKARDNYRYGLVYSAAILVLTKPSLNSSLDSNDTITPTLSKEYLIPRIKQVVTMIRAIVRHELFDINVESDRRRDHYKLLYLGGVSAIADAICRLNLNVSMGQFREDALRYQKVIKHFVSNDPNDVGNKEIDLTPAEFEQIIKLYEPKIIRHRRRVVSLRSPQTQHFFGARLPTGIPPTDGGRVALDSSLERGIDDVIFEVEKPLGDFAIVVEPVGLPTVEVPIAELKGRRLDSKCDPVIDTETGPIEIVNRPPQIISLANLTQVDRVSYVVGNYQVTHPKQRIPFESVRVYNHLEQLGVDNGKSRKTLDRVTELEKKVKEYASHMGDKAEERAISALGVVWSRDYHDMTDAVIKIINELRTQPLVLAGCFNIADLLDAEKKALSPREMYQQLGVDGERDLDFLDAYTSHNSQNDCYATESEAKMAVTRLINIAFRLRTKYEISENFNPTSSSTDIEDFFEMISPHQPHQKLGQAWYFAYVELNRELNQEQKREPYETKNIEQKQRLAGLIEITPFIFVITSHYHEINMSSGNNDWISTVK